MIDARSGRQSPPVQTRPIVARLRALLTLRVRLAVLMGAVITGVVGLAAYLETRQFEAGYLRDLETQYDIVLPREEGFETLAGFVMDQLGKIPKGGERFEFDGRRYTVLQMDGHRIVRVKIENLNPPAPLEQAI